MAKKYKKRTSKVWILITFILFVLLIVLSWTLLKEHGVLDSTLSVQANWDNFVAWWNGLGFVQDIKGWFNPETVTTTTSS